MSKHNPFQETLRSEYDAAVLDYEQRERRAERLFKAFCAAGLWPKEARLLDVGCGSGLMLTALGDGQAKQRIGSDLRWELYAQARQQVTDISFAQADGSRLPFPGGYFHVVTCLAVIGEFPNWQLALDDMARCVAAGGVLYVTVTNSRFFLTL